MKSLKTAFENLFKGGKEPIESKQTEGKYIKTGPTIGVITHQAAKQVCS